MPLIKVVLLTCAISLVCIGGLRAEKAVSLQQAKQLSAQLGKPILMEFVHED